jgi:hypothetical protein
MHIGGLRCPAWQATHLVFAHHTLERGPDREFGPLLIQPAQAGFDNPIIKL